MGYLRISGVIVVLVFTLSSWAGTFQIQQFPPKGFGERCSFAMTLVSQNFPLFPGRYKKEFALPDNDPKNLKDFISYGNEIRGKDVQIMLYEYFVRTSNFFGKSSASVQSIKVATVSGVFRAIREEQGPSPSQKIYYLDMGPGLNGRIQAETREGQAYLNQIHALDSLSNQPFHVFSYPLSDSVWHWTKIVIQLSNDPI